MTTHTRDEAASIRNAVRIAENICSLPAVATQDWCDSAAAALLPIAQPGVVAIMLGNIDERGQIVRREATGAAGCYLAEVTTTIGRSQSATSVVPIDARDGNLARLRTMLDQARELIWTPGPMNPGECRVGSPESLGAGSAWRQTPIGKRWEGFHPSSVLCGAAYLGIGTTGSDREIPGLMRVITIEIGSTSPHMYLDPLVLEGVLPSLAKRAMLAIGADAGDGGQWLTVREQIILKHLLLGKSVREIAEELGRSPHTVHDHVKSLHRKLNANSRGELVARALGYGSTVVSTNVTGSSAEAGALMP